MAGIEGADRPPALPWTVRIKLAAFSLAHRPDGSVRHLFCSLADLHAAANPRPDATGVRTADVTVDASRGLCARVFSPSSATKAPLPVVIYFHDGGFTLFSAASRPYDALYRRLCSGLDAVVVSVNYRRAPEHRFPAAYDDGVDVLRYLDANGLPADVAVPMDLSCCFVAGDSAGGNIAHHVVQRWTAAMPAATSSSLRLDGVVLIQPFFGGEEPTEAEVALDKVGVTLSMASADAYWRDFLPDGASRDHAASRVCGERVELAETFPPAMVAAGRLDILKGWQARYVEALRAKGKHVRTVEYPGTFHGFHAFPQLRIEPSAGIGDRQFEMGRRTRAGDDESTAMKKRQRRPERHFARSRSLPDLPRPIRSCHLSLYSYLSSCILPRI